MRCILAQYILLVGPIFHPIRSTPFRLSLLLQLQDIPSHSIELLFDSFTEKRILLIGQSRGDLRPLLTLQCLNRCRKEITLFHGDMVPFVLDEVENDVVDGMSQDFPIRQYTLNRLRDPPQKFGAAPVLGGEIANICSRGGIAHFLISNTISSWG